MAKRRKPPRQPSPEEMSPDLSPRPHLPRRYQRALNHVEQGEHATARRLLERIVESAADARQRALAANDLATLAAQAGEYQRASEGYRAALALDPDCRPARLNLALLGAEGLIAAPTAEAVGPTATSAIPPQSGRIRVAILSFLFNWPSTGGGTVHTYELAGFLQKAGYEVRHIYARFAPWGIGGVEGPLPYPSEPLEFAESDWNVPAIQAAFRRAVDAFDPDCVIITDSWNSKPILAEAVRGYPYFLRLQALECLCPLNNVRLLPDGQGGLLQCPKHQLANPEDCAACLRINGGQSGALHRAERDLCGVGSPQYRERLLRAFREAEAVLAVNPLIETMVSPYSKRTLTVTAGMDPERFPWPWQEEPTDGRPEDGRLAILFAGLVQEPIKGFAVLHEACSLLWRDRRDFELLVTDAPPRRIDEFTRFVGWQSQADLPRFIRAADILAMPTVAQEALGRTAVEAMAAGRPVVASRLGGLPFTVVDGATGLLCEPGDPEDLARKLATLLDDPALRERLGRAGRERFEAHYAWPVIVERHYRPILKRRQRGEQSVVAPPRLVRPPAPPYAPVIPAWTDQEELITDVARFFGRERAEVQQMHDHYRSFSETQGYARTLGELKTLCVEEAFVLRMLLDVVRPRTIVEVGTQHGKSTRRILDIAGRLGLGVRVVCFDTTDQVRCFGREEAELVLGDLNGRFREAVLGAYRPGLVFLDVHTYPLLKEAIAACLDDEGLAALVIHDCGRGLCNPRMGIARDDPAVSSATGVWERHVLGEVFDVEDPLDGQLDERESPTHRLRIFDTPHGLAVLMRRSRDVNH